MRRQRSVSFYAETEDEYIEEYNKNKSISERRRCRSRSYAHNNDENSDEQGGNNYRYRKKFFQSYDDLELDQLGVNSTFQIANIEKEEPEENENGLIQKINNINLSFKENNNNSFFSNLAPFTKNIIGSFGSKKVQKDSIMFERTRSDGFNIDENLSNDIIKDLKKDKKIIEENSKDNKDDENNDDNDYENLLGIGAEGKKSYHMRYIGIKDESDSKNIGRERNNSIIEKKSLNDENECVSFLDNISINELHKMRSKINDYDYEDIENENINENYENYISNFKIENNLEEDSINKGSLNDNLSYNFENNNKYENNKDNNFVNNEQTDDKKLRRYTFDINAFIPDNNYSKDGEENDNSNPIQNKTLQNFISKNEFLSKNIDYVDEHLKFLITGSDIQTKHLFLNHLLNEKSNYEDNNYDSFNIIKKVIKLLGDFIKLELYEEDCSLCYNNMLKTYIDFSDGVILIINMNISSSAKYIYDIIDKLKYKIDKDKRHFNVILLCFEIVKINTDKKDFKPDDNSSQIKNNDNTKECEDIINKIKNQFEIKPNYITFYLNNKEDCLKSDKFELVINKFLSLSYLKKERKIKKSKKKNLKQHKRGITGL